MMGRFGQCNGPFWTIFLEIKILGAVLVGAVLAMGRFGIDPMQPCTLALSLDAGTHADFMLTSLKKLKK